MNSVREMKRVAVFGNAGGGKSTLARQIAEITSLPLHALDTIKYKKGGEEVPHDEYLQIHTALLQRDSWVIDGFGCKPSAWARFSAADTLIYVDLPLITHYLWVTKRLMKGFVIQPEGWPENSPLWRGTLNSYRVIPLCHKKLTPEYRRLVSAQSALKRVHHLESPEAIRAFIRDLRLEYSGVR